MNYHEKQVYNILDFIGDIGGLFDGLKYTAQFSLGLVGLIWNEPMYMFIIGQVFQIVQSPNTVSESRRKKSKCCSISHLFESFMHRRRVLRIGIGSIDRELNISRFLIKQKLMWQMYKHLLPK